MTDGHNLECADMSAHSKLAMAQRGNWRHVPQRTGPVPAHDHFCGREVIGLEPRHPGGHARLKSRQIFF